METCQKILSHIATFLTFFLNVQIALSLHNTWLRFLHLLYDTVTLKTIKYAFSMFYTLALKHGFLTNHSMH